MVFTIFTGKKPGENGGFYGFYRKKHQGFTWENGGFYGFYRGKGGRKRFWYRVFIVGFGIGF